MSNTQKQILFWSIIYLVWTYLKSSGNTYWVPRFLLINIINLSIYIAAYFYLKKIQIPRYYLKKKYVKLAISLVLSSILFYAFWRVNGVLWIDNMRKFNPGSAMGNPVDFLTQTVQFYSPAMLLLVWDLQEERGKERERILILEKEKMATELKFLKAQLNPHFLFNTLNNLYSFVVNNSPKAPAMILQLSEILDYVLYRSQKTNVALREEIKTINNFLELEKIRYGDRLLVEFNHSGNLSSPISPLILLSIVENAFKHGASGDIDEPRIRIDIHEENAEIKAIVWNTKSKYQGEKNDAYKEGIGLSNVTRQLDLSYPNSHFIAIQDADDSFSVSLNINTLNND